MDPGFQNSGLGLYKGAFNIGLYLFILQENYLPISAIFGFFGIAGKVSSRFRIYIEYPPLEMDLQE
ncbi:hypothetical protein EO93_11660 [Methanosarcina sp. 1.H.A.2.2]|nr:hypothetical protein EO93_11660 [Methanosarcina sp. 1.H.A.2.2]